MDYKYICIECRNTFEPKFNKLKCTSGDCEYLDTSCYDIIFEDNNLPIIDYDTLYYDFIKFFYYRFLLSIKKEIFNKWCQL